MGRKIGGSAGAPGPFLGWVGPHLTQSRLGIPSGILVHPAVWVQWTWVENKWGLCLQGRRELG